MSKTLSQLPVGALVVDPNTTYYDSPIVWMKLEDDHDGVGNTTLLTNPIVGLKCFDAKEPNNSDSNRKSYGNDRWKVSNIRQWLNSDATAGNWYTAQHAADQAPNSANVWQQNSTGINPYDTEAGFMNGFSADFKALLQDVTKTTALNTVTDGGGSETTTDKIFLLSETEVGLGNENNIAEGTAYALFTDNASRIGKCSAECISHSNYGSNPTVNDGWYWWLRTPNASNSHSARRVNTDGSLDGNIAFYGHNGVRPACAIPSDTKVSDSPNQDGYYTLFNSSPTLILSSSSLGEIISFPSSFTYTVNDEDDNLESLTISLDGTLYSTVDLSQITQGEPTSFALTQQDFTELTESSHTLVFTATDSEGETATASCTFIKYVPPTSDRLVTHEDAARIISALNAIAYRNGRRFIKPTLTTDTVIYDGETHNVSEILDNFDSDFMLLTGDTTYFDDLKEYTFNVQLKRTQDTWTDDTTSVLTYSFTLEDNE